MAETDRSASHDHTPYELIRLLHRVALLATLVIVMVTSVGIYQVFQAYVINSAESDAVSVSEAFLRLERDLILHETGNGQRLLIDESEFPRFDGLIEKLGPPFSVIKIKIFEPSGRIAYSSDHTIIGRVDEHNERLQRALSGYNDSLLQTKEEVYDLDAEKRFDVEVVESYIPIRNDQHEVVGSFEVYQDISRYRSGIVDGVVSAVVVLLVIMVVAFTSAYVVLRLALNRLSLAQKELHRLATHDALTGMLNRGEVMKRAHNEIARYGRERGRLGVRAAFSLVMVDVDYFKQVNDLYGHQSGDQVLVQVAALIKSQLRQYSVVGRYGGEEFLLLLPATDSVEALRVAERIRGLAEELIFNHGGETFGATLSLGVATVMGDETLEAVIRRADMSLYAAKERGRNRVEMLDDSSSSA